MARSEQAREIVTDDVRAVPAKRVRLADAVDADDVAEVPGGPGLDAGQRVLEDRRLRRPTPSARAAAR